MKQMTSNHKEISEIMVKYGIGMHPVKRDKDGIFRITNEPCVCRNTSYPDIAHYECMAAGMVIISYDDKYFMVTPNDILHDRKAVKNGAN